MAGQLRVDEITDEAGTGSPSFPQGIQPNSLGTGTPGAGNFLRGDGVWEAVDIEGEIEAFAGGEPGQPRLVGNGVSEFPGTYPVLTVTASDDHNVDNGTDIVRQAISLTNGDSNKDGPEFVVIKYTGTIRFRVQLGTFSTANRTFSVSVFKNNVLVQNYTGSFSSGSNAFTNDIDVVPNDEILWRVISFSTTASPGFTVLEMVSNTASNGYLLRELFAPAV